MAMLLLCFRHIQRKGISKGSVSSPIRISNRQIARWIMVEGMLSDGSEAYESCCVGKKMGCYEKRGARKEPDM